MLKALLRTRLRSLASALLSTGSRRRRRPALAVLLGVLMVYAAGATAFTFVITDQALLPVLAEGGRVWLYFAFSGSTAFGLVLLLTAMLAERQLFSARDNELLLSLPIPPRDILASRMGMLLVMAYLAFALVLVPAGGVYAAEIGFSGGGLALFVLCALALPLGALALSCLAGWGLAALGSRMRHKTAVSVLATVVLIAAILAVSQLQTALLGQAAQGGAQELGAVRGIAAPMALFGRGCAGSLPAALGFAAACAGAFAGVWALLAANFYRITTAQGGAPRVAYREKAAVRRGAYFALWHNELRHLGAVPGWIVNGAFGAGMALVLAGALAVRRDALAQVHGQLPADVPTALLLAAGICLCCGTCILSAVAISLEGPQLWILRSCPVAPALVLRSMAAFQLTITLPAGVLACAVGAAALGLAPGAAAAAIACTAAYCVLTAYAGVAVNLLLPKFDWLSEVQAVKQSMSSLMCMLGGFALVAAGAGAYLLAKRFAPVDGAVFLWCCTAAFAAAAAALRRWLARGGAARFAAL
jgi:ABC-2 type transport system permease protein